MITWTTVLLVYIIMGVLWSEVANIGSKRRFGEPISAGIYIAGVFLWPLILFIGGRR